MSRPAIAVDARGARWSRVGSPTLRRPLGFSTVAGFTIIVERGLIGIKKHEGRSLEDRGVSFGGALRRRLISRSTVWFRRFTASAL